MTEFVAARAVHFRRGLKVLTKAINHSFIRKKASNKQEAEGREERQKRQKTQKEEDDKTKEQKRGEQNQHKYSLRSGRFRVEDTQPD